VTDPLNPHPVCSLCGRAYDPDDLVDNTVLVVVRKGSGATQRVAGYLKIEEETPTADLFDGISHPIIGLLCPDCRREVDGD
jgi:hypothetical protein